MYGCHCSRQAHNPSRSLYDLRICSAASGCEKVRDACESGTERATSTVPYRTLGERVSNAGRWTGDDEIQIPDVEISSLAGSGLT
jgi:hypothetical protein